MGFRVCAHSKTSHRSPMSHFKAVRPPQSCRKTHKSALKKKPKNKTQNKKTHTQSGISVHVCVFIGKTKCKDEHVHLGMQINWTKQNSWTGPGLAAPIHTPTRTHAHAQTEDRNTAKHRPPSPLKWTCVHTQHLRQWHFILSSLPVNLKPFVYWMLRQKLLVYVDHL